MNTENHYLVIGAGPIGLAMAKSLKLANMPYHQVDANEDLGGNWFNGTYKSAHILSSRMAMEYTDFPMPSEYPDFPSSTQMLNYYQLYAKNFELREKIQFNTLVTNILPIENSLWRVDFENGNSSVYKGIMVCNGHHWSKRYPTYPGTFTGETIHSKEYKTQDQVKDKRVLVIGAGNSAFDIASECARASESTSISVRRGIWIFPKTFMGRPLSTLQVPKIPDYIQEPLVKMMLKLTIGSHKEYGLPKPEGKVFDRHPTVNTEALMHIKHGRIKVKGAVKAFEDNDVIFTDGTRETVDMIVYATGFNVSFPFLPKPLNRVVASHVNVYGMSMYHDYKGLYLVGWMQPRGGVGSLITPYADFLVAMAKIQEELQQPVGLVLKEMGEKLPTSHLSGGGQLIKWINKKMTQIDKIKNKGIELDKKLGAFENIALTQTINV